MQKTFYALFVLLLLSSASFAGSKKLIYKGEVASPSEPCCIPLYLRDGFYVGIGFGYDTYGIRQSFSAPIAGGAVTVNPNLVAKGWNNGEAYLGYGQFFDRLYLGGEVLLNSSSAGTSYGAGVGPALTSFTTNFTVRESLGAGLLPGLRLNRTTLLYARLGYIRSYFKIQETAVTPLAATYFTTTQWGNGFQFGAGIESAILPDVSVRGEFTYTSYRSFNTDFFSRFAPTNSQFILSLNYHFAF